MERFLEVSSLTIFLKKVILARFILLLVLVEMAGGFKAGFWSYLAPDDANATFQQVTVDRRTGTVFAAGKNSLLKLSGGTLVPLARYESGTATLGSGNDAKILEIASERLLFCGSARNGLCSVFSLNDLSGGTLDPENPANYLAGTGTVSAFFGSDSYLHVARTRTYRGQRPSPKVISSSVLQVSASNLSYHLQSVARLDFVAAANTEYVVRYVYGFEHGKFVYFLTVQQQSTFADELAYETRLTRFCRDDAELHVAHVPSQDLGRYLLQRGPGRPSRPRGPSVRREVRDPRERDRSVRSHGKEHSGFPAGTQLRNWSVRLRHDRYRRGLYAGPDGLLPGLR